MLEQDRVPDTLAPGQLTNATACMNYLYGFLDGYYKALSASGGKAQICIPTDATTFQLAAVFVKWGDHNPEKWHLQAGSTLMMAFQRGLPMQVRFAIGLALLVTAPEEQVAANKAQPPNLGTICSDWQGKGFASEAACVAPLQQRAISDLEWELSRYRQYLQVQSLTMSSGVSAQILVLRKKGVLDTRAFRTRDPPPEEVQCFNSCAGDDGWATCINHCMEMDPTGASIMRCGSDVLPF